MWCLCDLTPSDWCKMDAHSTDLGKSLSVAWTRFKDILQKVPHHEDLALYDNKSWNDPRDFAKPFKEISLPQDVPSTSERRLTELENQVQRLIGPHNTQYFIEKSKQAFADYASLHTDEAGGKWFIFKPEQNNHGDTYNPSWKSHPNLRCRQPQNFQNNLSNTPNRFQPNGSFLNRSFNNNPQNFSNLEGLVSNFMEAQDARLSKFEADFKRQQGEMTNKIDTVLKAINDRMRGALPSDTSTGGKLRDKNAKESWELLEDLALYDNESWNDPRDFAKPFKEISLPQDVPSTSDRHLTELENQVQRLM
nr:MAK10-like protein [Tanacetum cinerariifolium]